MLQNWTFYPFLPGFFLAPGTLLSEPGDGLLRGISRARKEQRCCRAVSSPDRPRELEQERAPYLLYGVCRRPVFILGLGEGGFLSGGRLCGCSWDGVRILPGPFLDEFSSQYLAALVLFPKPNRSSIHRKTLLNRGVLRMIQPVMS